MKYIKQQIALALAASTLAVFLQSCGQAGGNFTGREYMPDMTHSIAYEANTYSYAFENRFSSEEEYRQWYDQNIRDGKPVTGTIARGHSVYHYKDTEEERARAMAEITSNALVPSTEAEFKDYVVKGKNLYNIYCGTCHGEKGDGNGKLYNNGNGPYPVMPASYITDAFKAAGNTDGRFYHAIMYGKNLMLSHADKLNEQERWMVIHYIRTLQADAAGTKYDFAAATKGNSATSQTNVTETSNIDTE